MFIDSVVDPYGKGCQAVTFFHSPTRWTARTEGSSTPAAACRMEKRKPVLNRGIRVSACLVFVPSLAKPREFGKEMKFVVAKKADSLYKTVSAASIVAKVSFPSSQYWSCSSSGCCSLRYV